MDFDQLWQKYPTLVTVVVTAASTLVLTRIVPGIWKWLTRQGDHVIGRISHRVGINRFEKRYREWLIAEHRHLPVRGIRTTSPVSVELDQIYISLSLGQPLRESLDPAKRLADEIKPGTDRSPEIDSRQMAARSADPERLSVAQVLQRCPQRLTVLGGPGSGKTTLLSYLTLVFARDQAKEKLGLDEKRLPILIPLRGLPHTGLCLTAENLPKLCVCPDLQAECPAAFFKKEMQNGDCLILLDGMDEVTTESERRAVADQLEDFVHTYPGNRFIVTSRPAGYAGSALTGFAQFDVRDFDEEDVEAFTRQWCLAVELAASGAGGQAEEALARRRGEQEAEALLAAIEDNERVGQLTVNPLLLTIVALVHRYRATLPQRRVELYDECTQVLLGYWDQAKGITGQLNWACRRRVLESAAYSLQQQGVREISAERMEQVIAEALPTVGGRCEQAAEFLREVRERSGLLVEKGLGLFSFSHLTFQEYLTALYLAGRGKAGLEELLSHLHDPWWHEVTLLYAGLLPDASPLLQAILDPPDDLFRTNLFLAAHCLADVVTLDPALENDLLERLLYLLQEDTFDGLRTEVQQILAILGHSRSAPKIKESLLAFCRDPQAEARRVAVLVLTQLGKDEPQVTETVLLLMGDPEAKVRVNATTALGELGQGGPRVVEALLVLLRDSEAQVRAMAAEVLGQVGQGDLQVVAALLSLLRESEAEAHRKVSEMLDRTWQDDPQLVEILWGFLIRRQVIMRGRTAETMEQMEREGPGLLGPLAILFSDPSTEVCAKVAEALLQLRRENSHVVEALVTLSRDSEPEVRGSVAWALEQMDQGNLQEIETLLTLSRDLEPEVRRKAAWALENVRQAEAQVTNALLALSHDPDGDVRGSAVWALEKVAEDNPQVTKALLALLRDQERNVFERAACVLGQVARKDSQIIEILLTLSRDPNGNMRRSSAWALRGAGWVPREAEQNNLRVIEALLVLSRDTEVDVRGSATWALGEIGREDPQVIEALLGLLRDPERSVCERAARALTKIGPKRPQVISVLLTFLHDPEGDVRANAAWALGQLGQNEPCVMRALLPLSCDPDEYVRGAIARALGDIGVEQADPSVIDALLTLGHDPQNYVRRRAATALAEVGESKSQVVDALLALLDDRSLEISGIAAETLEGIASRKGTALESLDSTNINRIRAMLSDSREFRPSYGGTIRAKDLAWNLLYRYSQSTRQRIYQQEDGQLIFVEMPEQQPSANG